MGAGHQAGAPRLADEALANRCEIWGQTATVTAQAAAPFLYFMLNR